VEGESGLEVVKGGGACDDEDEMGAAIWEFEISLGPAMERARKASGPVFLPTFAIVGRDRDEISCHPTMYARSDELGKTFAFFLGRPFFFKGLSERFASAGSG